MRSLRRNKLPNYASAQWQSSPGPPDIIAECTVSGFDPDNGQLILQVTAQDPTPEYPGLHDEPRPSGDYNQVQQQFYKMEYIKENETIVGIRFHFSDPSPEEYNFHWRARARYLFKQGGRAVSLPTGPDANTLYAGPDIETDKPGWTYAQL